MRLVVGVGAQKAGTSWLADYLDDHPSVLMSPIKELHFFDKKNEPKQLAAFREKKFETLKKQINSVDAAAFFASDVKRQRFTDLLDSLSFDGDTRRYSEFFRRRLGDRKFACEITPSYSTLDAASFRDIRSAAEQVQIVFLLRNPVERFWSAVRMAEGNGNISGEADYASCLTSNNYKLRGDYRRTFNQLLKAFDRQEVYVEFYESLFTEAAIRKLCAFLDIDYRKADFGKEVNKTSVTKGMPASLRAAALKQHRHVYEWAFEEFGDRVPESWHRDAAELRGG